MIYSRRHNFIFVRTGKVGGTSVEFALAQNCGPDDIIAPHGIEDELTNFQLGLAPRNFARPEIERAYISALASGDLAHFASIKKRLAPSFDFWDHMSARNVRDRLGRDIWDTAFKFSIIRHPYEYVLSKMYHSMSVRNPNATRLKRYRHMLRIIRGAALANFHIVTIDGQVALDKVLRHDRLKEDLHAIAPLLGFDISEGLPRRKSQFRPEYSTVQADLDPILRWLIRKRWKQEFDAFDFDP